MKKPTLGVDVDLTVVDTLASWMEWMNIPQDYIVPNPCSIDGTYNNYFMNVHGKDYNGINRYWAQKDVYDHLQPMEGAVEALEQLSKDFEIKFISVCYENHIDSKRAFLDRFFHGMEMISQPQKELETFDIIIEDNPLVLDGIWTFDKITQRQPRTLIQLNQVTHHADKKLTLCNKAVKFHVSHWDGMAEMLDCIQSGVELELIG